jgi:hypothetical protein
LARRRRGVRVLIATPPVDFHAALRSKRADRVNMLIYDEPAWC